MLRWLAEHRTACDCLSFSPIAVHPDFQRRGIGRALIETTFEKARKMGHQRIVIFGRPSNDVGRAFVSCKKMKVCPANVCSPSKPAYTHYPIFRNQFDFCVEDASYDLPVNFSDTVRLRNKIRVAAHSVCRKMLRRTWNIQVPKGVADHCICGGNIFGTFSSEQDRNLFCLWEKRIGFTAAASRRRRRRSGISPARRCCTSAALPPGR